jgi:subtilase family serine protease
MRVRSIDTAPLSRSRRARLLALPLLLGVAFTAQCWGSSGSWAATSAGSAAARASDAASASMAAIASSAAAAGVATTVQTGAAPADVATNCLVTSQGECHTPQVIRAAYGIQPLLDRGIDGRGETVTVLSPAPSSSTSASSAGGSGPPAPPATTDVRQDLAAFDSEFGLPAARIEVVTTLGGSTEPWWEATGEEVGDFEVLHTVAPGATLRVVWLPSDVLTTQATATNAMVAALRLAVTHTDVASISWSIGEHYFTNAQLTQIQATLQWAAAHHVTVDAASGDHGASSDPWWGTAYKEVSLPSSSPLVLGVGGTTLTADSSSGAYEGETAMTGPPDAGSGGGFSSVYARPGYQNGVAGTAQTRGVPDVSAAAVGNISFVFTSDGETYILALEGTSGSAPLWGGVVMLADQLAHHDLGLVNPALYRIAGSPAYHQAFHDITAGDNTVTLLGVTITGYQAGPGWDPVTGLGSPNAQVLVPLLAATRP